MAFPDVGDNSLLFQWMGNKRLLKQVQWAQKKTQPSKHWKNASKQYTVTNNVSEVEEGNWKVWGFFNFIFR